MATYTGVGRTNHFRVTSIAALSDTLNDCCVQIHPNPDGSIYLIPDTDSASGLWHDTIPHPDDTDDTDDTIDVSIPTSSHHICSPTRWRSSNTSATKSTATSTLSPSRLTPPAGPYESTSTTCMPLRRRCWENRQRRRDGCGYRGTVASPPPMCAGQCAQCLVTGTLNLHLYG